MISRAMDNLSIRARCAKAHKEIVALDKGAKRWTMSIPVDSQYDSDEIFSVLIEDIEYLLAENAARLRRIAELEAQLSNGGVS